MALYRETYQPSARHPAPYAAVCVWALAADTEAEAERQYWSAGAVAPVPRPRRVRRRCRRPRKPRHIPGPRPSGPVPSAAVSAPSSAPGRRSRQSCGALAGGFGVDEVAVLSTTHDPQARRRSYALIAEAADAKAGTRPAGGRIVRSRRAARARPGNGRCRRRSGPRRWQSGSIAAPAIAPSNAMAPTPAKTATSIATPSSLAGSVEGCRTGAENRPSGVMSSTGPAGRRLGSWRALTIAGRSMPLVDMARARPARKRRVR